MGIAALKIKIMPESVDTDLEEIKQEAEKIIIRQNAKLHSTEIEEIAFGLKALVIMVAWPEEKDTDIAESLLSKIENVSSVSIEDYRRAFG